ncbi:MAG: hypothetical protein QXI89_02005 [Candidatus Anstonellales archaeon]
MAGIKKGINQRADMELILKKIPFNMDYRVNEEKKLEWLALCLGLINEGESRLGMVAVLYALIQGLNAGIPLTISDIKQRADKIHNMSIKTIYYHVKRLKEKGIVKKINNAYIMGDGVEKNLYNILSRIYKERFDIIMHSMEEPINSLQVGIKH